MKKLFRKEALKRIHSPEELDSVIKLAMPLGWLTVIIISLLLVSVVVWSFMGRLSYRVQGLGIIYNLGGQIYEVSTMADGIVDSLEIENGSTVQKGEILATIALPQTQAQLNGDQAILVDLNNQFNTLTQQTADEIRVRTQALENQTKTLKEKIIINQQEYDFFDGLYHEQLDELEQGYITKLQAENTRVQRDGAMQNILDSNDQIENLQLNLLAFKNQQEIAIAQLAQQIVQIEGEIDTLAATLNTNTYILSPTDGIVTNLAIKPNMTLTANQQVAIIEEFGNDLRLITYFSIADAKRIDPGLGAQVTPLSIERNRYGSVLGSVETVNSLPETQASLLATLENESLVQEILQAGPVIKTVIDLEKDDQTISGLKWSSSVGPPNQVTAGTTASAIVTLYQQRPIEVILPFFKAWTVTE